MTPSRWRSSSWTPQKQPPARIAVSVLSVMAVHPLSGLVDGQDNLAVSPPLEAASERLARRREWEHLDVRGPQLARIGELRDRPQLVAVRLDDEVHAAVRGFLRHRDQSPAGAQEGDGPAQVFAAHSV